MVGRNKQTITIAIITAIEFLPLIICLFTPSLAQYTHYVFLAIIFTPAFGFLLNKGELSVYKLDKDFIVYEKHFEVETFIFDFKEIKNLIFHFESFQNMYPNCYETDPDAGLKRTAGSRIYGLANTIAFSYKSQMFNYRFYVQNQAHFFEFVQMLEYLYISHINFNEENWYGKTFLMQNVNAAEYDNLLAKY